MYVVKDVWCCASDKLKIFCSVSMFVRNDSGTIYLYGPCKTPRTADDAKNECHTICTSEMHISNICESYSPCVGLWKGIR